MKIKADFVTNSSSTSFILITNGSFIKKDFLKSLGVNEDSEFRFLFDEFFDSIKKNLQPIREYCNSYEEKDFKDYILENYSEEVLNKILQAEEAGKTVYMGRLSSESGSEVEAFFCTDSFIIDNETMYFNGTVCVW